MSENDIAIQQKVVMTRNGATFYLDLDRAAKVEALLLSPNKPDYIEIDDTLIAVREITMVAPAEKVEEMNRRKKGDWQCGRGHWHSREETICKNGWGMVKSTPTVDDQELTPLQKDRGAYVKELMSEGLSLAKAIKKAQEKYPIPKEQTP